MSIALSSNNTNLPIRAIIPEVHRLLAENANVLISASPGAGKSTLLPLTLLNEPWLNGKKILLLEPRRLAATTIAKRMASLLEEPLGQHIGYRVRFNSKVSQHNKLVVVTEGILTRMIQDDNALEDFGLVIFDEFHERSIHADLALAFCLEAQQVLRPDLKLMVMSATLDLPHLAQLLKAPIITCPGQSFPVEIIYTGVQELADLPVSCAKTVLRALRETKGDVLVFLPGQATINRCRELLNAINEDILIYALYGQLSLDAQTAALLPDSKGKRKVVLATSIAETSLTIEGVQVVVDTGFTRSASFDAKTGLSSLKTIPISLDSALQRSGRAGRLGPGTCYRMWSKATETRMLPYRQPEILAADLLPLALDLLQWGVKDAKQLTWLNPPPTDGLIQAQDHLKRLGIMINDKISEHGKAVHRLPCHPRIAHLLLKAEEIGLLSLATDLAALLEERDPLNLPNEADISLRLTALRKARAQTSGDKRFNRLIQVALAYRSLFRIAENNQPIDAHSCGLLLSYAYPDRVASAIGPNGNQFIMANGRKAILQPNDSLLHEPLLAIAQVDAQLGEGKIFLAAPLEKEDLLHQAARIENVYWDSQKGGLIAQEELKFGNLILQAKPLAQIPPSLATKAVLQAIAKEGLSLLNWDTRVEEWQNSVNSLRVWNPAEGWPLVDTTSLLQQADQWLLPYITNIKRTVELKKLDLAFILQHWLPYEKQLALHQLAPTHLTVPSGSLIKLRYHANGDAPILAVRLQEVFGLLDTPLINAGKTKVVLHLLSPGYKAVQVTADLRSFWDNTYFEVKKDLKRRYPKHAWPDNPLTAQAIKGVRRH